MAPSLKIRCRASRRCGSRRRCGTTAPRTARAPQRPHRLERHVGTRLQCLAVDHWDTDNPHTHVLIRGRRPDGQELFIPSRLISSGIREQAQEIVTRVLGPRLGVDLVQERFADISRMAVTPLDRELAAAARAGAAARPGR